MSDASKERDEDNAKSHTIVEPAGVPASQRAARVEPHGEFDVYKGRLRITSDGRSGGTKVTNELGETIRVTRVVWDMQSPWVAHAEIHTIIAATDVVAIDPVLRIRRLRMDWKTGRLVEESLHPAEIGTPSPVDAMANRIRLLEVENEELRRVAVDAKMRGWDRVGAHACPDLRLHAEDAKA